MSEFFGETRERNTSTHDRQMARFAAEDRTRRQDHEALLWLSQDPARMVEVAKLLSPPPPPGWWSPGTNITTIRRFCEERMASK